MPTLASLAAVAVASTDGAAILGENGAVRLAGDASGLEPERSARPFDFYGVLMQHDDVSMRQGIGCARAGPLEARARVDMS